MRQALRWAAAGMALPALYLELLTLGAPTPVASAVCACGAMLPAALDRSRARPTSMLAAAIGALAGTLLVLPAAGAWGAMFAAVALAACGQALGAAPSATPPDEPAQQRCFLESTGAAVAAVGVWRCLAFLLGHSLYAAVLVAAAGAAGLAAGRALRGRAQPLRDWLPGAGPLAAGLIGLMLLHLLRLIGLNAGQAEHVKMPVYQWIDAWWLCFQAALGVAGSAAALAALEGDSRETSRLGSWAALAAPFAAAAALGLLRPAGVAALGFASLCGAGAWRGFARWRAHPILSRAVPAALLIALGLGVTARRSLEDITLNRLISVYPGGRMLLWSEARGQALAVYRFSSGLRIALRDGVADISGGASGLEARLPLLAHVSKRALLAGTPRPETLQAAAESGVELSFYDPHPSCAAALAALTEGPPLPPTAATASCGRLRPPPGPYDAVIVAIAAPFYEPTRALQATRSSARRWRRLMAPDGLLAWRLPTPAGGAAARRAAAALQAEFPDVAEVELGEATLLMASQAIDSGLIGALGVPWRRLPKTPEPLFAQTRPLTALPARLRR